MVYISSTGLASVQNKILNRLLIRFYNLTIDLKTPPYFLQLFDLRTVKAFKWALNLRDIQYTWLGGNYLEFKIKNSTLTALMK